MSRWPSRNYKLDPVLEKKIEEILRLQYRLSLSEPKRIAESVIKMSDFYLQNPTSSTPWRETWCQVAQLTYFLPLNSLRLRAAIDQAQTFHFFEDVKRVFEFGSGLGPFAWSLQSISKRFEFQVHEASPLANDLARRLGLRFEEVTEPDSKTDLTVFANSLTELDLLPKWVEQTPRLLIVEPGTEQDGRRLMQIRKELIQKGFSIWAPCTHQQSCPLLEKSPRDWCHDRIHFDQPAWWLALEDLLPMKNKTLTMSYLIASRTPRPDRPKEARLIGDFRKEKGKSRQALCAGPERQFFAWLEREGAPDEVPRGYLVQFPEDARQKGNELRPQRALIPSPGQKLETT